MEGSSYEIWKDIPEYEGLYQVSNCGNVRSLSHKVSCWNGFKMVIKNHSGKMLTPQADKLGYLRVRLSKNGHMKSYLVHRLVAEAFILNIKDELLINHKDENPRNNHVSNLEWCSVIYNNNYGTRNIRMGNTMSNIKKKPVYCIETNTYYPSSLDAQIATGIKGSQISSCCNKRRYFNTAGGYHWKYSSEV